MEYKPKVSDPRSKATGAAQLAVRKVGTSGDVFGISFLGSDFPQQSCGPPGTEGIPYPGLDVGYGAVHGYHCRYQERDQFMEVGAASVLRTFRSRDVSQKHRRNPGEAQGAQLPS